MISGNWKFSPVSRTITDMKRTLTLDSTRAVGERITASGWVHARRDHGGLIFVDLRDHAGLLQLVFNPDKAKAFRLAEDLRDEFVIRASGVVTERAEDLRNDKIPTGGVELLVDE